MSSSALLTADQCCVVLIDCQPQPVFTVSSQNRHMLRNNLIGLARCAALFDVPVIFCSHNSEGYGGLVLPELLDVFPRQDVLDRLSINPWMDPRLGEVLAGHARSRVLLGGTTSEGSVSQAALCMLEAGYQVACVEDACAGLSHRTHNLALERLFHAGVMPLTWLQCILEWQGPDDSHARRQATADLLRDHAGALGMVQDFLETMVLGMLPRGQSTGRHRPYSPSSLSAPGVHPPSPPRELD